MIKLLIKKTLMITNIVFLASLFIPANGLASEQNTKTVAEVPDADCDWFRQKDSDGDDIFQLAEGVSTKTNIGNYSVEIDLPEEGNEACGEAHQTATPIVVCDHIVFPMHFKGCSGNTKTDGKLWAVSLEDGSARIIANNLDSESSVSFAKIDGRPFLVLPRLNHNPVSWIDLETGTMIDHNPSADKKSDSSGIWDPTHERYIFGLINSPRPTYQNENIEENPGFEYAGALFAVSLEQELNYVVGITALEEIPTNSSKLDLSWNFEPVLDTFKNYEDGIRAWFVGSPTFDGTHFFAGTGAGHYGTLELYDDPNKGENKEDVMDNDGNACSAIALDGETLDLVSSYDPGEIGCVSLKVSNDAQEMSATTAELPIDKCNNSVWVQWRGQSNTSDKTNTAAAISRMKRTEGLDKPICSASLPKNEYEDGGEMVRKSSASFYQSPVIDSTGAAWMTHLKYTGKEERTQELWRIRKEGCGALRVLELGNANYASSPTLGVTAEGNPLVYVASGSVLYEIELNQKYMSIISRQTYSLAEGENVSAPIIDPERGRVVVVSASGIVNFVNSVKAVGYGDHVWPRIRRDNTGTAYNNDECSESSD